MTSQRALRGRPPDVALAWVLGQAAAGSWISSLRRLRGGTSSATHAINVRGADGALSRYVLRRFVRLDWLEREPDLASREGTALERAAQAGLPTPALVAVDADGANCDVPAVLTQRLPGRIVVDAEPPPDYFESMARLLPPIHALPTTRAFEQDQPYFTYIELGSLEPPRWTTERAAWERVIAEAQGPEPAGPRAFIHRDFHPGNVLWSRGSVSGLVDWVNASYGPPGIDVGHCRTNCALLFGVEGADAMLSAYLAQPGSAPYEPHWDCRCVVETLGEFFDPGQWHDVGRHDMTLALMRRRLDAYTASLSQRLD